MAAAARLALVFVLVFAALRVVYDSARDTAFERVILDTLTVKTSALLLRNVSPIAVEAQGNVLVSPRGQLMVAIGCEGTESIFLLIAAIASFRAAWRLKLWGILLGTLFVFALNQIRIAGLFLSFIYKPTWFDALHGFLAPTAIVLAAAAFFFIWTERTNRVSV